MKPIKTIVEELKLTTFWNTYTEYKTTNADCIDQKINGLAEAVRRLEEKQNEIIKRLNQC